MGNMITIPVDDYELSVYEPRTTSPIKGGLIVIHEVWALNDHTKKLADQFSAHGYKVIAPNLLSEMGISEKLALELQNDLFDPERRSKAQPKVREFLAPLNSPEFGKKTIKRLQACFEYLYALPEVSKKIGVTGFCFGGSYSFSLAMLEPRLVAAIPFYGHASDSIPELHKITCPVMAFYGEQDENLIKTLPELQKNMKIAGVNFTSTIYKNCGHAFVNDTNVYTYNKEASEDALHKTTEFLDKVFR
ncbi:MAG: dienelactone hydrolase family protein [Candidatus Saccharimonadales bacterium]